jgi:hypothetical protein
MDSKISFVRVNTGRGFFIQIIVQRRIRRDCLLARCFAINNCTNSLAEVGSARVFVIPSVRWWWYHCFAWRRRTWPMCMWSRAFVSSMGQLIHHYQNHKLIWLYTSLFLREIAYRTQSLRTTCTSLLELSSENTITRTNSATLHIHIFFIVILTARQRIQEFPSSLDPTCVAPIRPRRSAVLSMVHNRSECAAPRPARWGGLAALERWTTAASISSRS